MSDSAIINIHGLQKRRVDSERVFELVVPQFTLHACERVALVGPSGSGKSTLIDILALALAPDIARHFYLQHPTQPQQFDVAALWQADDDNRLTALRARYYGYVQQLGGLLEFLKVKDNIALSLRLSGQAVDVQRIHAISVRLGIEHLLEVYPAALSVGQQQRVAIARALIHQPAIVLADEPTASLDIVTARTVMEMLLEASESLQTALIIATHDLQLIKTYGLRRIEARTVIKQSHQRTLFAAEAA